jgi:hypothetical protein
MSNLVDVPVGKIKNLTLRRLVIVLTFPFLAVGNIIYLGYLFLKMTPYALADLHKGAKELWHFHE